MAGTITHEWQGTTLIITSDSGTSGMNLAGPEGQIGIRGPQGPAPDLTAYSLKEEAKKAAPRNILDNSNFVNPVNQRGQQSYSGNVYGIDRWKGVSGDPTMTINQGSITFACSTNGGYRQYIAGNYFGKSLTIACEDAFGDIYCASSLIPAEIPATDARYNKITIGSASVVVGYLKDGRWYIQIITDNTEVSLKWIALYEGEYSAETLPSYQPKGYYAELAECQRYYIQDVYSAYGFCTSVKMYANAIIPGRMRIKPSVTNITLGSVRNNGKSITPTSISCTAIHDNCVTLNIIYDESAGAAVNTPGIWTGSISLSAEY